jgi:hypothetical protein
MTRSSGHALFAETDASKFPASGPDCGIQPGSRFALDISNQPADTNMMRAVEFSAREACHQLPNFWNTPNG